VRILLEAILVVLFSAAVIFAATAFSSMLFTIVVMAVGIGVILPLVGILIEKFGSGSARKS
jgi:hypothetical protein